MPEIDVYLDPDTGDLPTRPRFCTGIELIEQRIRLRLKRGIGEWFLDPNGVGLPLLEWRQQKPPNVGDIVATMQAELRAIPGVTQTRNFDGVHDPVQRRLTITGTVIAEDGAVTSLVVTTPLVARNTVSFAVSFTRGSGPIVRPPLRGL